jgi:hypothetical protein
MKQIRTIAVKRHTNVECIPLTSQFVCSVVRAQAKAEQVYNLIHAALNSFNCNSILETAGGAVLLKGQSLDDLEKDIEDAFETMGKSEEAAALARPAIEALLECSKTLNAIAEAFEADCESIE